MFINNNTNNIQPDFQQTQQPRQVQDTTDIPQVQQAEETTRVDSSVLKAYAGIQDKKKVSKDHVIAYFRQIGLKDEARFDSMLKSLTDKDGQIPAEAFEFLKQYQAKNHLIWDSLKIFDAAKNPDGNFNYKALQFADTIMDTNQNTHYSYSQDYCPVVLKSLKNNNGTFNDDAIKFFTKHSDYFKKVFIYNPKYAFAPLKNKDGEFDKTAMEYADEKLSKGVKPQEVFSQISEAKDENGNFSFYIKNLTDELNSVFDSFKAARVKKIALSFAEDKKQQRVDFIELAKTIKDDDDFIEILNFITEAKEQENNKSGLDFDRPSVDFVKNLVTSVYDGADKTKLLLEKTGKPYNAFSERDIETLKRLFMNIEQKDIELFIDAATRKSGPNKGNFESSALEKYLDMYFKNNRSIFIPYIEYMSKCFALEEDDYALDTFAKLFNLRWSRNTSYYSPDERIDPQTLRFILMMSCLEHDGHPKRPCYKAVLDRLNKLMTMKLPMSSKDAFENFITYQDLDIAEKIEKVNFEELGIKKTGQISSGIFKRASEEELLHFKEYLKDYLKDKNINSVNINLNRNIDTIVELTTGDEWRNTKLLYDIQKGEPTTEIKERKWLNAIERKEHNFKNNTVTTVMHRIKKEDYADYETLKSMMTEKFDADNNLIYKEQVEPSVINGVFNITRTYPDGRVEKISDASKTKEGNEVIEKKMESLDGTKTYYRYEDDPQGNRILDYKITDKNGKELLNRSVTFEVIDENHFVSSSGGDKFDIKFDKNTLKVKNLQNGKIVEIDLKNFTKDTSDLLLPVLKSIPGNELFKMKELDLKTLYVTDKADNAAYSRAEQSIMTKEQYIDLGVLLHEWGHAKDELMFKEIQEEIKSDKKLREIYNQERAAFRDYFCDAQLSEIGYFTADYHYLGSDSIKEGIAETNTLLSTCPKNETQAIRSHYWQQYFPRTIAYLAGLLE